MSSAFFQQEDMYSTTDEISELRRRASFEYEHGSAGAPGDSNSLTYGTAHRMAPEGHGNGQNEDYAGTRLVLFFIYNEVPYK